MWGEFPPKTTTGISISNQAIYDILQSADFKINLIEEFTWNKSPLRKIISLLLTKLRILYKSLFAKTDLFYFTISLSVFGLFKVMTMILPFYLFSRKTKRIGHIHRGDIEKFAHEKKWNRKLLGFVLNRTDVVVVLSEQFKKDLEQLFSHKQIAVLHNTSSFEKEKNVKREYNKNFVCISNYIKSKGIEDLVDCFNDQELNSLNLSVYGQVYDQSYYEKLEKKASANIKLNKALDHGHIASVLEQADCLILPSWNEGQPIIILEAMSVGIPIISTTVGDIPNILGKDYPFLSEPKDANALKEIIRRFDQLFDKYDLSQYLFKRYKAYYSNEHYIEMVQKIFF
jgi:glycosyltransferase involved in cell wall biosynthesis